MTVLNLTLFNKNSFYLALEYRMLAHSRIVKNDVEVLKKLPDLCISIKQPIHFSQPQSQDVRKPVFWDVDNLPCAVTDDSYELEI